MKEAKDNGPVLPDIDFDEKIPESEIRINQILITLEILEKRNIVTVRGNFAGFSAKGQTKKEAIKNYLVKVQEHIDFIFRNLQPEGKYYRRENIFSDVEYRLLNFKMKAA